MYDIIPNFKHLWNHEKMFETGVVRTNECQARGIIGISV